MSPNMLIGKWSCTTPLPLEGYLMSDVVGKAKGPHERRRKSSTGEQDNSDKEKDCQNNIEKWRWR